MATFELYEDLKVIAWRRVYYTIEADSLEEAKQSILDGEADCEYSEMLDGEDFMDPDFCQNGQATHEIYDKDNDLEPIYTNELQIQ